MIEPLHLLGGQLLQFDLAQQGKDMQLNDLVVPLKGAFAYRLLGCMMQPVPQEVGRWQGRRARYRGLRKNLFDLRRCAVVHNLHVLARSQSLQADLQDTA